MSSAELVEAAIARIEASDGAINAVVVRDFERARVAARAADRQRRSGRSGALLGLPVTVKEGFDAAGLVTSWGLPGQRATARADAVLVARLKAAGAVILGKTDVPTMLTDWQTTNPVYGVTNNPWNMSRTPGGSSGGGAAAVAAGMIPLDFGSDLGGSLRIPAAFCGVYAHRPSYGLLPMRGFAPPMAPRGPFAPAIDQATVGPIARCAQDLMLALDAVAGPDDPAAIAYRLELPPARSNALKDFRVLVLMEHPLTPTAAEIRDALARLASRLEREGCEVGRDSDQVPPMIDLARTFGALLMSQMSADMPDDQYAATAGGARAKRKDNSTGDAFNAENRVMSHRDWVRLDRHRLDLGMKWRETFQSWDVVLCPVAPTCAFAHDSRPFESRQLLVDGETTAYTNVSLWTTLPAPNGLPATAISIGLGKGGMPIGIRIIGPPLEDRTTLEFARLVELACGGFVPPG